MHTYTHIHKQTNIYAYHYTHIETYKYTHSYMATQRKLSIRIL